MNFKKKFQCKCAHTFFTFIQITINCKFLCAAKPLDLHTMMRRIWFIFNCLFFFWKFTTWFFWWRLLSLTLKMHTRLLSTKCGWCLVACALISINHGTLLRMGRRTSLLFYSHNSLWYIQIYSRICFFLLLYISKIQRNHNRNENCSSNDLFVRIQTRERKRERASLNKMNPLILSTQ